MRKIFIPVFTLALSTACLAQSKKKAPNVLFILVDDMQSTCIHAYGCDQVHSPNIDRIVDNGISFTRTYTNGSLGGALSMPSRAMIMTGRGVYQVIQDGARIPEQHVTLPELLRQNGYTTFATGKWHSDLKSFNRSFEKGENIFFGGMHSYQTNGHVSPRLYHYDPAGDYAGEPFTGKKFSSEMFADAAVEFLQGRKKEKSPFFAYVAFTSPHDPRMQHPDYAQNYKADTLNLPINFLPQHPFDNGDMKVRDEVLSPIPRNTQTIQKELAGYYGMISEVDTQIGRIIQALKESGQMDNTILVFASDNGLAVGQHGLLGKQNLYDHSVRVPLVISVPGLEKEKGTKKDVNCYLYDVYPTLCDLTGTQPAPSVTGKSLLPVIKGADKHRDCLFLAYNSIQRGLVKDGWKYIIYNVGGFRTEQLFDLKNDPWEMVNHAQEPAYAFKLAAYKKLLKEEMEKNNDFCNLDDFFWWGKGEMLPWNEGKKLYTDPDK